MRAGAFLMISWVSLEVLWYFLRELLKVLVLSLVVLPVPYWN